MQPPGSQDRPGGCRFEVRGVAVPASPPLWAGAWETSRTARPDADWVWHCVQEARRSFSIALFFSFISKRASFLYERPPPLLSVSPRFCCAFFSFLFHSWLYVPILTPCFFFSFLLRFRPVDLCLLCLLLLSSLSLGWWPANLMLSITTSKKINHCPLLKYETIAVAVKTLGRNESASVFKPATYWAL